MDKPENKRNMTYSYHQKYGEICIQNYDPYFTWLTKQDLLDMLKLLKSRGITNENTKTVYYRV